MLFNYLIKGIMPVVNRLPVGSDNDKEHHNALIDGNAEMTKMMILPKVLLLFP